MIDYSVFYRDRFDAANGWQEKFDWDLFVSAYSDAERVRSVFELVRARKKHWIVFPEYGYSAHEYPTGAYFVDTSTRESEYVKKLWGWLKVDVNNSICIDITGLLRPHLMFLVRWLAVQGVREFDALYSEPIMYRDRDETKFSDESVIEVRQVDGFEGNHLVDASDDWLIIGAGYDHRLISHVAEDKGSARKIQMFGLPSLQADMYQENRVRAFRAAEDVGATISKDAESCFAPANDPFVVASVLQSKVNRLRLENKLTNLYLSPLATRPQALGFALYYLFECDSTAASIIYPVCLSYPRETTRGLSKVWRYHIEF